MKVRILLALLLTLALWTPAQEIQVLAYNVFLRPGLIGMDDYKAERFAELVEAVRPYDIIGLSEVFDDDRRKELKNRLHNTHPYAIDPPESDDPFLQDGGITFFSRYPVVFSKKIIYEDATGWDECSEKGAIFARLSMPNNKTWDVVLTHTQADSENAGVRQKQFNQLHNFIRQHHQSGPLFVMGDLNVIGDTTSEYADMIQRLGSPQDVYRHLNTDPGYTWNGPENPLAGGSSLERLDYILYQGGAEAMNFSRCYFNRFPMARPTGKAKYMSDHYGVGTVIQLGASRRNQESALTTTLRLPIKLDRSLRGTLTLRDTRGNTSRQDFTIAAGDYEASVQFAKISAGTVLIACESEGRSIHAWAEAGTSTILRLPYGNAGYRYLCPADYAGLPVMVSLQGEMWLAAQVKAGEKIEIGELPEGKFVETVLVGNRPVCRDIMLTDGEIYVSGESRGRLNLSGIAPAHPCEILLCPEAQECGKPARAFVHDGKFYIADIAAGDYRLLVREKQTNGARVSLLPLSLAASCHDLDVPAALTPQANGKNYLSLAAAPVVRMVRMSYGDDIFPAVHQRADFLAMPRFGCMPLPADNRLLLADYPSGNFRIGLYVRDGEVWKLESTTAVQMQGGVYEVK